MFVYFPKDTNRGEQKLYLWGIKKEDILDINNIYIKGHRRADAHQIMK